MQWSEGYTLCTVWGNSSSSLLVVVITVLYRGISVNYKHWVSEKQLCTRPHGQPDKLLRAGLIPLKCVCAGQLLCLSNTRTCELRIRTFLSKSIYRNWTWILMDAFWVHCINWPFSVRGLYMYVCVCDVMWMGNDSVANWTARSHVKLPQLMPLQGKHTKEAIT